MELFGRCLFPILLRLCVLTRLADSSIIALPTTPGSDNIKY
jgi:hypothetical protein